MTEEKKEIKRLYVHLIGLLLAFCVVICALDRLSMLDDWRLFFAERTNSIDYISGNVGPDEIKPYIDKVRKKDGTTKLIIGDSVCNQMYDNLQKYNPDFTMAGTNGAITMAGQYILAKLYLDNHPDATDVFLIVIPSSFGVTFDTERGYLYAVMPFVETNTIQYLEDDTLSIIGSVYGKFFTRSDVVNAIDKSAINRKLYLNTLKRYRPDYPTEDFQLAEKYVTKINKICLEHNVRFHLYPGPFSEYAKAKYGDYEQWYSNSVLGSINPRYYDMVYYYPDEQSEDGYHFSGDYNDQKYFNDLIMNMFGDTALTDELKFE